MRLALAGLFCACGGFAQATGDNIVIGPLMGAHLDTAGNVIFADLGNDVVCRSNPNGTVTGFLSGAVPDPASAAPGAPVKAGALDAAVDAAAAASATPPNVKNPVSVTVGEAKATVSSATLAAGYTGLYQVRIAVPDGVATGDATPLVVSVLGQSSLPVNIAVR